MTFDLNVFMKIGPVASGLLIALLYWGYRTKAKKNASLEDVFTVGITASSFPSGFLFIASAFDSSLLVKVSEAPVYIAFAGIAVLFIAVKTVREKSKA